ncbi:PGN_0703 family putative restriction endonuclease [Pararoseomonas indoligenes]|uniref:PD-(D/E)XK nuclease-like domain-containing protein n=1 Tax=Roseomonas indoligenes TaxID=2820811 RepID=A0A940SA63_9PROT|nr:hypothetical protein [Pararoseomonas indoligenes]MBP0496033.1 hypothetical protein [Pararoseomonas indoligenes]
MRHDQPFVPLLPEALLRRHRCHEATDTRFRAAARLAQSLWRESQGLPCGRVTNPDTGRRRPLGSRLTATAAKAGANFLDPSLVPLVRRELAWREPGAVIEERRLWGNLLSSQALAFSLFLPLKRDLALATKLLGGLFPDLVGIVTEILLEHSPGRGHPALTADRTAFDVLVRCTTPTGRRAFLAIEVKYSEAPGGTAASPYPPYDDLSRAAGVYRDPDGPALRSGTLGQFWRQQLLATAMLRQGLYDAGRVVVLAPAPNADAWRALEGYADQLKSPEPAVSGFEALPLEAFVLALAKAGADAVAEPIARRYLDLSPVYAALDRHLEGGTPPEGKETPADAG